MRFIFYIYFVFFIFDAYTLDYSRVDPQLCAALDRMEQCEATRRLIEEVERQGPISLLYAPMHAPFGALWNSTSREIVVNAKTHPSLGEKISSIVFELHNALTDSQHQDLFLASEQGTIQRNHYIYAVEKLEYHNAKHTSDVLAQGVAQGLFPQEALWSVPDSFQEHLACQRDTGHSEWIGQQWDLDQMDRKRNARGGNARRGTVRAKH